MPRDSLPRHHCPLPKASRVPTAPSHVFFFSFDNTSLYATSTYVIKISLFPRARRRGACCPFWPVAPFRRKRLSHSAEDARFYAPPPAATVGCVKGKGIIWR